MGRHTTLCIGDLTVSATLSFMSLVTHVTEDSLVLNWDWVRAERAVIGAAGPATILSGWFSREQLVISR